MSMRTAFHVGLAIVTSSLSYQHYRFHTLQRKKDASIDEIDICHRLQMLSIDSDVDKLQQSVREGLEAKRKYKAINEEIEANALFRLFNRLYGISEHGYFYQVIGRSPFILDSDKMGLVLYPYGWNSYPDLLVTDIKPIAKDLLARNQHLLSTLEKECTTTMFQAMESEFRPELGEQEINRLKGLVLESKKKWTQGLDGIAAEIALLQNRLSESLEKGGITPDEAPTYRETLDAIEKRFRQVSLKVSEDTETVKNEGDTALNDLIRVHKMLEEQAKTPEKQLISVERAKWSLQKMEKSIVKEFAVQNVAMSIMGISNCLRTVSAIVQEKEPLLKQKEDL